MVSDDPDVPVSAAGTLLGLNVSLDGLCLEAWLEVQGGQTSCVWPLTRGVPWLCRVQQ